MDRRLEPVAFSAPAVFAGTPLPDGTRAFSGVAYSGGVITDHPWLDRVVFDLGSTRLETPAAALFDHSDPIGVVEGATINGKIEISGRLFSDLEGAGKKVAAMADRGMPWQLSVGIWPGRVEEIKAGAKVDLNGRTFDGPLTVFRDARVREVSFVALGADDKTRAQVFTVSEGGKRPSGPAAQPQEDAMSDVSKAEHDRIVTELQASIDVLKATNEAQDATIKELRASAAKSALDARTAAVRELFKALGREFKDDATKPYLEMSDEAFAAVAGDLKTRVQADPDLFRATATGEGADPAAGKPEATDIEAIRASARKLIDEAAKRGVEMTISEAVARVTAKHTS